MELAVRGYDTKEQGRDPTAEELSEMQAWESLLNRLEQVPEHGAAVES